MGKSSRRRMRVAASATILLSSPFLGVTVEASDASSSSASSPLPPSAVSLTTAFSCGSRWTKAKRCAALCPTGDDGDCPPGQYCYAGIPCEGRDMASVLERQRDLERMEMDRLTRRRGEGYADSFVCGANYEDAEGSCNAPSSPGAGGGAFGGGPRYCPTGDSSQCPAGTECYVASCSRRAQDKKAPPLVQLRLPASTFTDPILHGNITSTIGITDVSMEALMDDYHVLIEEWRSFYHKSQSLFWRVLSMLSSSRYCLN